MNKSLPWILLVVLIIAGVVFTSTVLRPSKEISDGGIPSSVSTEQLEAVQTEAPVAVINSSTGEVDEAKFERNQVVNEDTSLTSIEKELTGTIILEEDFSDL